MARKFRDLIASMPPERRERIERRIKAALAEMPPNAPREGGSDDDYFQPALDEDDDLPS
jgi:hypothetical protein